MWETRVQSLGREDPLEKEMATHSSTIAWRIPWMEEPDGLQSMGSQRVGHDRTTSLSFFFYIRHVSWAPGEAHACLLHLGLRTPMIEKTVVTKNTFAAKNLFSLFLLGLGTVIRHASCGITQGREENRVTWLERVNGGNI